MLLDADFENSTRVIDRLVSRIDSYDFPTPLRISVGAACYPTHAVDADTLEAAGGLAPGGELARRPVAAADVHIPTLRNSTMTIQSISILKTVVLARS